jgi:hypothetical protein
MCRTLLEQNRSLQDTVNRLQQQQATTNSWEKLRRSKSRRTDRNSCPQQHQLFDSSSQQQQLHESCQQQPQQRSSVQELEQENLRQSQLLFDSPLLQTVDSLR